MINGELVKRRSWSLEEIKEVAKKVSSRSEFKRIAGGAYEKAKRVGWLNQVCAHMNNRVLWDDKEKVAREAQKYIKRSEFYLGSAGAYKAAISNGWLDDVCGHMGKPLPEKKIYSREDVFAEAKRYQRRSEFSKMSGKAYDIARENGWLDECCAHMKKYSKDLNFEEILDIAKKFQTRKEFFKNSPAVHNAAKEKSWYEEVCKHMQPRYRAITREELFEEARKYRTRTEFYQGSKSHYRAALKHNWMDDCCAHMLSRNEKNKKVKGPWIFTKILDEAQKYDSLTEFRKKSPTDYTVARKLGFIDEIRDFMDMN